MGCDVRWAGRWYAESDQKHGQEYGVKYLQRAPLPSCLPTFLAPWPSRHRGRSSHCGPGGSPPDASGTVLHQIGHGYQSLGFHDSDGGRLAARPQALDLDLMISSFLAWICRSPSSTRLGPLHLIRWCFESSHPFFRGLDLSVASLWTWIYSALSWH